MKMNDMLFRGKEILSDEWVYGYYARVSVINDGEDKAIDPKTFGQYTGLHDKIGKKIFDGDILVYYPEIGEIDMVYGKVLWDCDKARFCVDWGHDFVTEITVSDAENTEIVGNIYDDTDMLNCIG